MQYARNQHSSRVKSVKDNVTSMLHTTQARAYIIAGTPHTRIVSELLTTLFKGVNITDGLVVAPRLQRIPRNLE